MRIEILQSRAYRVIGAKQAGWRGPVPNGIGEQLVRQGFAREIKAETGPAPKPYTKAGQPRHGPAED